MSQSANMILVEVPDNADPALRDVFDGERDRHMQRLQGMVRDLFDNAGRYGGVYYPPLRDLVIAYINCLHGTILSTRSPRRKAEIVHGLARPMAMVLDGPRRMPVARVRATWEVQRLIADTEKPAQDPPPVEAADSPAQAAETQGVGGSG